MNELWARLRAATADLAPRERLLVGAAGGLLALVLLYGIGVRPFLLWRDGAHQRADAAREELQAVLRLRQDYDEVNGRLSAVEGRIQQGPRGNIFTTLESLATQNAVKVDSMEPQAAASSERYRETRVQVVLKGVTLAQVVSYLQGIESAPQVLSVKALRLRTRADKPDLLDVTFTVSSFEPV